MTDAMHELARAHGIEHRIPELVQDGYSIDEIEYGLKTQAPQSP